MDWNRKERCSGSKGCRNLKMGKLSIIVLCCGSGRYYFLAHREKMEILGDLNDSFNNIGLISVKGD